VIRLTPGDPTDLEILRVLDGRGEMPVFVDTLAPLLGIEPGRVSARLGSLVTLGYVDCLIAEKGQGDGYRLTSRGRAELLRRAERSREPPAGPAGP
jgi:hypothetical protein